MSIKQKINRQLYISKRNFVEGSPCIFAQPVLHLQSRAHAYVLTWKKIDRPTSPPEISSLDRDRFGRDERFDRARPHATQSGP